MISRAMITQSFANTGYARNPKKTNRNYLIARIKNRILKTAKNPLCLPISVPTLCKVGIRVIRGENLR